MSKINTNINLSKNEMENMKKSYDDKTMIYNPSPLSNPIKTKTYSDDVHENNFKFFHIFIIAGVTLMLLRSYQNTEPSLDNFIISG